jgi:hypothetical protein
VISVPALICLAYVILRKGSGSGIKMLYIVNVILAVSMICFFLGSPIDAGGDPEHIAGNNFGLFHKDKFFLLFAICFPAFTGMTAGVGLSGDLKNPGKSIPLGTMGATVTGLIIYILVVWKLSISASQADLIGDQLIMAKTAFLGAVIIPVGLAACTFSSAMGSIMVAPRTLQALAGDKSFPFRRLNLLLARGKGKTREPYNASLVTFLIALVFVLIGDVDMVAGIISMFFLITYGTLCLISFLNHFGSPPSYRPKFRSRWYFSLTGFLLSVWVMFRIDPFYTILSYAVIVILYLAVEHYNKDQKGLMNIFKGALFQLNRRLQVFMQKQQPDIDDGDWRPAAICISSAKREKALDLMKWISYQHGFGTYFHFMEGYYNRDTHKKSQEELNKLIEEQKGQDSTLYLDTMISPSYTSAIAQVIQSPSISGMENNMVVFEFEKNHLEELDRIIDNISLVKAGDFDVCILAGSPSAIRFRSGIHVWIKAADNKNTNLMILLGYIIMAHPDWRKSYLKIFSFSTAEHSEEMKKVLEERIATGRLPITLTNIEIIRLSEGQVFTDVIAEYSGQAGLTIIGFDEDLPKQEMVRLCTSFNDVGGRSVCERIKVKRNKLKK